ncbi:ABC transporter permease [Dethiobacter alkaliphilus]|uniref:ABC transporter permease n=1 Tax=Dethiobacter alkaliphilus TaxID=427926 RepID=UPI002227B9BD|nr:FtsX-like permease family protein [Dethiobacter alkaliphilus]MCW3490396.1 FtsX-like permease family protein [Dethiobacter alkaliphilus]
MFKLELFLFVWNNLWRTKVRTILTIAGVFIGTGLIMTMVSLGIGLQESVEGELSDVMDLQVLEVMPGFDMGEGAVYVGTGGKPDYILDRRALAEIAAMPGVAAVSPLLDVYGASVEVRGEFHNLTLVGMDYNALAQFELRTEDGEIISRPPRGVLVGNKVQDMMGSAFQQLERGAFRIMVDKNQEPDEMGTIDSESRGFRMNTAAVLAETGGMNDYAIIVPLDTAEEMLEWMGIAEDYSRNGYDRVHVRVATPQEVDVVTHELSSMGYFVFSPKMILEAINTVFLVLQVILGSIGAIALLVASLGIVNTMVMSIYERTREIGIMKVVGASLADIRNIFILEAAAIGLLGGIAGIAGGWLLIRIIYFGLNIYIMGQGGEPITPAGTSVFLVGFTIMFAVTVGIVSGLYPAIKAMKLSPLAAIRQE